MRTTTTLRHIGVLAGLLLAGTATGAQAQFSGDPGSGSGDASTTGASKPEPGRAAKRAEGRRAQRQVDVSPYLEVGQVLTADLKNGGDVLTYTNVAVGVDAAIVTTRALRGDGFVGISSTFTVGRLISVSRNMRIC